MIINNEYKKFFIKCLLETTKREFPDLEIDYILDVGSRAKGEATPLSDYDFQVTSRDGNRIISNKLDINSDIKCVIPYLIDSKVASIYGLPLVEIEQDSVNRISDVLEKKFHKSVGLVFVDTRSCLLNLAFETAFSAFRTNWFTLTSNVVIDRVGMQPAIQNHLIYNRCFHWEQTIDLQIVRFANHLKINSLLAEGINGNLIDGSNSPRYILSCWINWSINYLRFAIGTWSLALNGFYTYRRNDILRFISARLPPRCFQYALLLYKLKNELKLGMNPIILREPYAQFIDALIEQREELENLLNAVISNIIKIRPHSENIRFMENAQSLLQLATQWFTIPKLDLNEWIYESIDSGKNIILSYGR